MSALICGNKTKKSLKEDVANDIPVMVEDPSFINPFYGTLKSYFTIRKVASHPVTNRDRKWFATAKLVGDKLVIS